MRVFNRSVPREAHGLPLTVKEAERESEEQFKSLLVHIPAAVYRRECVEPWTVRFISDHVEVLTGYPAGEFTKVNARSLRSIISPEDRPRVIGVVRGRAQPRGLVLTPVPPGPRERRNQMGH